FGLSPNEPNGTALNLLDECAHYYHIKCVKSIVITHRFLKLSKCPEARVRLICSAVDGAMLPTLFQLKTAKPLNGKTRYATRNAQHDVRAQLRHAARLSLLHNA